MVQSWSQLMVVIIAAIFILTGCGELPFSYSNTVLINSFKFIHDVIIGMEYIVSYESLVSPISRWCCFRRKSKKWFYKQRDLNWKER